MKALIICGSGNRNGFTWEMCVTAADALESAGAEVVTLDLTDTEIKHCSGCESCKKGEGCKIPDDMHDIYGLFSEADLLILATPIRFSGPSSEIKTVIDRFQPLWYINDMSRPKYVAAMMCGGSDSARFESTMTIFRAFAITAKMEWVGELRVSGTDKMNLSEVRERAESFVAEILKKTGV